MRICLLLVLLSTGILPAASGPTGNMQSGPTWVKLMSKYSGTDNNLKTEMKEQMLSDLVYASYDPDRVAEVKMFIEIIHRCMNGNNSDSLSREFLYATLQAFHHNTPDALPRAETVRDDTTVTDQELAGTKQILRSINFTEDLNGELPKLASHHIPACTNISCDATPEDLQKMVDEGTLSEEQIVRCMHARTLVTLAAFCLLADRKARKISHPAKAA